VATCNKHSPIVVQSYSPDLAPSDFHLFGPLKQHLEVANSTVMEKWKWLFVNGRECLSPISAVTEFLNSRQDGTSALMC
jgi:hypothetical protein